MKDEYSGTLKGLFFGLIMGGFMLLSSYVLPFTLVLIIYPAFIVFIGNKWGYKVGILSLLIITILVSLVDGWVSGIMILVMMGFLSMAVYYVTHYKKGVNYHFLIPSVAAIIGIMIFLQIFKAVEGISLADYMVTMIVEIYRNAGELVPSIYGNTELSQILINSIPSESQVMNVIRLTFSPMTIITAAAYGIINLMAYGWISKKYMEEKINLPEFMDWELPRGTLLGFSLLLGLSWLLLKIGVPNTDLLYSTLRIMFLFGFGLMGLCTAAFYFNEWGLKTVPRRIVIILIIIVCFIPLVSNLLIIIGFAEGIFKLRKRRMMIKEQIEKVKNGADNEIENDTK